MSRQIIAVLCAALAVLSACSNRNAKPAPRPPVAVSVATAHRTDVPYTVTSNGTVTPVQVATVVPQVDGLITKVAFREGDEVKQGQVLFQIEPHPYLDAYRQALATLNRDRANAANAEAERKRYDDLAAKGFVTNEQADQIRANAAAAEATVRADEAAVASAKFNLDKTTVRAPIGGRTGSLLVRAGNVVHAAQATPLVVINQIRPILVRFTVPGTELALIQHYGAKGGLAVTATPATPSSRNGADTLAGADPAKPRHASVDSADAPTSQAIAAARPAQQGTLYFIDNAVDTTTGTITLKASFPNPTGTLWAGEFVLTSMLLFNEPKVLVVPAPAVQTGQRGSYVYVVDSTSTARQRPVAVERTAGDVAVIASGLTEGERVVTDGQSRLTPGAKVTIVGGPRAGT
ncbi:MAG TPA: efflux RND transporter periplasmic adaptor subunit [Gemmatimonadales bacterium]|nr:efflux RND transporter periplasmic adaptor subunit [Gemmatimonadales bacterium]